MSYNSYMLNVPDKLFQGIKNVGNTIEVRLNKEEKHAYRMKLGDRIIFKKIRNDEILHCIIINITLQGSIQKLSISQGVSSTLLSKTYLENSIKSIESIPEYKDIIEDNEVFAIIL